MMSKGWLEEPPKMDLRNIKPPEKALAILYKMDSRKFIT